MSHPHFVLSCKPNWSHLRSLCVLASKFACARPIIVTILVANVGKIANDVVAEVARCLKVEGPEKGAVRSDSANHWTIAVGPHNTTNTETLLSTFNVIWQALLAESPLTCGEIGTLYPAAARPSLVVLDGFQLSWLLVIKSMDSPPPVLQWMMGFSGGFLRICGPAVMGGRGETLRTSVHTEPSDLKEGKIIRVVGMPPMYDWEFSPQDLNLQMGNIRAAEGMMSKFVEAVDGLATSCAVDYDGEECLLGITNWISQTGNRPTFHLGPMLPFKPGTCEFPQACEEIGKASLHAGITERVTHYMDRIREKYGESSMVYISFGTEHCPIIIYILTDSTSLQLLAHAYRMAKIPEHIIDRFRQSEAAIFTPWAPQQAILAHKACGWFVTHGGANGAMEAVSQGVPMIGWPFAVDQPVNIAHLVHGLDVAFEFTEVRTGESGLKPIFVTGRVPSGTVHEFEAELKEILDDMEGEVGARKRSNARRVQGKLAEAWKQNGKSRQAFEALMDRYCRL
ncbi:hypothetical protein MMC30_005966 [Trapelia coarctata]|nr:hypothetical protein [Trapelia coarctata]